MMLSMWNTVTSASQAEVGTSNMQHTTFIFAPSNTSSRLHSKSARRHSLKRCHRRPWTCSCVHFTCCHVYFTYHCSVSGRPSRYTLFKVMSGWPLPNLVEVGGGGDGEEKLYPLKPWVPNPLWLLWRPLRWGTDTRPMILTSKHTATIKWLGRCC